MCACAHHGALAARARVPDDRSMRYAWAGLVLVGICAPAHADDACVADETLSHAAAELLLSGRPKPDPLQLTAAVRDAGSDAVALHAVFLAATAPADAEQKWLAGVRARSDAPLQCGSAQTEAGRLVITNARAGALDPIDPKTRRVRGSFADGFTRAELVVAAADGQLVRVGVSASVLARGVELEQDLVAPLKVQLLATGSAGPRPIAERWLRSSEQQARADVTSGARPGTVAREQPRSDEPGQPETSTAPISAAPPAAVIGPAAPPTEVRHSAVADPAQADLGRLVAELREARGRKRLHDNRLLREAAASHAQAVCEQGRVAHTLDHGHGPEERLAQAGISARLVGEAIARAADGYAAFESLQNSPSHLLTLLEPRFTDFGVGEARDNTGKRCYVVLLCAWPRFSGKR